MENTSGDMRQAGRPPDKENGRPHDPEGGNPPCGTAVQNEGTAKASPRQRTGPRAPINRISRILTPFRLSLDWLATLAHVIREALAWARDAT